MDRADLLIQMAVVAGKKNPEQVRLWTKEALRTASEMHPSSERSSIEARALGSLALVNGEEALAMLSALELPASQSPVSDARSIAATEVFNGYLNQHPAGWERISTAARSLGDSGFYPYRAVQGVIERIGEKSPKRPPCWCSNPLGYFMHAAPDPVATNQMAGPLKQGASFIDRSQFNIDLHGIVGHMFKTDGDANRNGNPVAPSDPSLDQVTLSVLLPSIESVDPEWAAKLRHDNPGVQTGGFVLTFDMGDRPAMTAVLQVSGDNFTKGQSAKNRRKREHSRG